MGNIYDQHRAAFANVSAYVILNKQGARVASVAFKFPRDGAGHLYCYLHVFGTAMVRGFAGGYGYDKQSAAVSSAAAKVPNDPGKAGQWSIEESTAFRALLEALKLDDGYGWDRNVEKAGFIVMQAV